MSCQVTVTYPHGESFNMEYYINNHMPLAHKLWKPHGMTGYSVAQSENKDGSFNVLAVLHFESSDKAKAGMEDKKAVDEIMADVKNYTQAKPEITICNVTSSV